MNHLRWAFKLAKKDTVEPVTCSVREARRLGAAFVGHMEFLDVLAAAGDARWLRAARAARRIWKRRKAHKAGAGCIWAGCKSAGRGLHAHHIVPCADGGSDDDGNVALLCKAHHVLLHGLYGLGFAPDTPEEIVRLSRRLNPHLVFAADAKPRRNGGVPI